MKDILIIGDSCRDIFIYCDTNRLCPDVPVPILTIRNQQENGGMAKNVQRNIQTMIKNCDIITNKDWNSITKTRYVHLQSNHTFFRVDSDDSKEKINLKEIDFNYKIIVISDYNKGFLSEEDIKFICSNHPLVFIDTKKKLGEWVENAKFIKINNHEYNISIDELKDSFSNKIIHTDGSNGCFYLGKNYPVKKVTVKDTTGAGDTFMSALVIKFFETNDIEESIRFANECASKVVTEKGVTIL